MSKDYTSKDIRVLTDREHVRLRLPVYAGNTDECLYKVPMFASGFEIKEMTFIPAVYKCVGEVIDNCTDEFAQIQIPNKTLKILAEPSLGHYVVSDNGRGVPIDMHETGKHTPEVVFGSLRSGRNFSDDKSSGVIGMNGMGAAFVNFCSAKFDVTIKRNNQLYQQTFTNGAEEVTVPNITDHKSKTSGTTIEFTLDPTVFKSVGLPEELIKNRAMELAFTNPGITVVYNDVPYQYKHGFEEIIKGITENNGATYFKFERTEGDKTLEFFFVFGLYEGIDEQVFTWVNSSFLFDGGLCNTQILNSFYDKVIGHLTPQAKKQKCEVSKNDIRQNLLIFSSLKIANPVYDAQSKTRMTGPSLRKDFDDMIDSQWKGFARQHKEWLDKVLERAFERHHRSSNDKAIKDHEKNLKKKVVGLIDATSTNRLDCKLIITEGLSAASMITEVRNPKTMGIFPLTGKINNVYGNTAAQIVSMGKLTNLLSAIGLVPGKKANRDQLRYGQIIAACDADSDGNHIILLIYNMLYQFWPELFDATKPMIVFRLLAPNVVASNKKVRKHFLTRDDYEQVKEKYRTWTIEYMKGLGSMSKEDWDMILSNPDCLQGFVEDGELGATFALLFNDDADSRKKWLTS